MRKIDYLERVLTARVYDVASESPLELAPALSRRLGNRLLLKREDLQPVFSFKLRGAYNKMARLAPAKLKKGRDHRERRQPRAGRGAGCAEARLPRGDRDARHHAEDQGRRGARARRASCAARRFLLGGAGARDAPKRRHGYTSCTPTTTRIVIAGQGTIGMEILAQARAPDPRAVRARVGGGGGLIGGIAAYVKRVRPAVRIIGVEPGNADAMTRSLKSGRREVLEHVGLFADGVAVKQVGEETLRLAKLFVDEMVLVDTDEICAAIKDVFEDTRVVLEPAGALAIAGAKAWVEKRGGSGKMRGPHAGRRRLGRQHQLRPPALRCGAGRAGRASRGGAGCHHPRAPRQASGASARRSPGATSPNSTTACQVRRRRHIFVGVRRARRDETARIKRRLERAGCRTLDLSTTRSPIARAPHGGRALEPGQERIAVPLRISRAARAR
jgi:threonine dehydratase